MPRTKKSSEKRCIVSISAFVSGASGMKKMTMPATTMPTSTTALPAMSSATPLLMNPPCSRPNTNAYTVVGSSVFSEWRRTLLRGGTTAGVRAATSTGSMVRQFAMSDTVATAGMHSVTR
ncbi:hypothetical protein [Gordonibacter urolithinfaciens]|uniref:hypothetical protein n=1 Tax=Gordonibacter urolithinfaciens TaxID=1335613 RepID=UPI003A8FC6DA